MKLIKLIEERQPINPTPAPVLDPVDPQELMKWLQAIKGLHPVAPKAAPAKKPLPKRRSNLRPVAMEELLRYGDRRPSDP